jgi:hypothetical protein
MMSVDFDHEDQGGHEGWKWTDFVLFMAGQVSGVAI